MAATAALLGAALTAFGAETLSPFTVFRPVVFMNRSYKAVGRRVQKKLPQKSFQTGPRRPVDLPDTFG